MPASSSPLILYTYYRSSCSGRLRIALNLKTLPHTKRFVDLQNRGHQSSEYSSLNPSRTVPCLIDPSADNLAIGQSVAALEYLNEAYPSPPLLPLMSEAVRRANVRQLVNIVACDMQPLINRKVAGRIAELGADPLAWARNSTRKGLETIEAVVMGTAGRYCVGDGVTLADVMLAPMVWNAEAYGVDFEGLHIVRRVYEEAMKLDAFQNAHWSRQEDCPHKYSSGTESLPTF